MEPENKSLEKESTFLESIIFRWTMLNFGGVIFSDWQAAGFMCNKDFQRQRCPVVFGERFPMRQKRWVEVERCIVLDDLKVDFLL